MRKFVVNSICLVCLLCVLPLHAESGAVAAFVSQKQEFSVEIVSEGLKNPWGMVFLPGGDLLVTERPGHLRHVSADGIVSAALKGLPEVAEQGQGGLMGIALHPEFSENRWVYLAYAAKGSGGYGTEVVRGSLRGDTLTNVSTIFRAEAKTSGGRHFGSRLVFARDGSLYISLGDRGTEDYAQDLGDHRGSMIRLNADGSIPDDNPFVNTQDVRAEIFSYGHRNMQGMTMHPGTGRIWTHEHGPQGGDEINIEEAGVNYGWPLITYGVNYVTGTKIGEGTHKTGMRQPLYKWVPSIAPSGMTFYSGEKFPAWHGNLFVGSLKFGLLVRLEIRDEQVVHEERLLNNSYGRIRDVVEGPDGLLYLLTDDANGKLLKLSPR